MGQGVRYTCREALVRKGLTEEQKEQYRKTARAYRERNRDRLRENRRRYEASLPPERREARRRSRRESAKAWAKRNPEKARENATQYRKSAHGSRKRQEHSLLSRYGISLAEFDRLVASQGGHCASCGRSGKQLVIDHSHRTGKVRGLICQRCNVLIGYMERDSESVAKCRSFIEKHEGVQT